MKHFKPFLLILALFFIVSSCFNDNDDVIAPVSKTDIGDFVWKAMNLYYLYKDDVTALEDNQFATQNELNDYINTFATPESFFENLIYDRPFTDKFSWIVSDYRVLEASFTGTSNKNGMSFGFFVDPNNMSNSAYGYVRYVLPNSDAEAKGITRGVIFKAVNGINITYNAATNRIDSAIINSLRDNSYSIELATFDGVTVITTGSIVNLTKTVLTENPVLKAHTINANGTNVGYLLYNQFTANFDDALNNAFAGFLANGITELVLDFRYNSGGSVHSAITLASLVTGQFSGQVFSTEQWNNKIQAFFQTNDPNQLINKFITTTRNGQALNSLNLTRVYIITTGRSASASELIINGLNPYINVVQIGTATAGKFQASITLYDGDNFTKNNINLGHNYAIQPLVLKSLNSAGFTDYFNGFTPTTSFQLAEDYSNLGVLGNVTEPLLEEAICDITGLCKKTNTFKKGLKAIDFKQNYFEGNMVSEKKLPEELKYYIQ